MNKYKIGDKVFYSQHYLNKVESGTITGVVEKKDDFDNGFYYGFEYKGFCGFEETDLYFSEQDCLDALLRRLKNDAKKTENLIARLEKDRK